MTTTNSSPHLSSRTPAQSSNLVLPTTTRTTAVPGLVTPEQLQLGSSLLCSCKPNGDGNDSICSSFTAHCRYIRVHQSTESFAGIMGTGQAPSRYAPAGKAQVFLGNHFPLMVSSSLKVDSNLISRFFTPFLLGDPPDASFSLFRSLKTQQSGPLKRD